MARRFVIAMAFLMLGAAPSTIAREAWISAIRTALPIAFCKPDQYFRQCFNVTQAECEQTALSATRVCLDDLKSQIPEVLKQPGDGAHWGAKVGQCAGSGYEVALSGKRVQSVKCDDPSAWTPKQ